MLPFSLCVVLQFTQPISAAILSYIFVGEKLSRLQWFSILFAMVGVIIMTNPQLIFFWTDGTRGFNRADYPNFNIGVCFALGHSVSSGFAYLFMRKMGTSVDPTAQTFQFGFLGILMGIPLLYFFDNNLE